MTVAVVIPTLNEEAHIGALLAQLARVPMAQLSEIVVADGGSRDDTRLLVTEASGNDARIRLLDNPRRTQSAGVNSAIAGLDQSIAVVVRIDAHADYPDDYVPRVVAELKRTGADVLATRLHTSGVTRVQRAIAAASNSVFGAGGSQHRQGGFSGFVDHGHHAGLDRLMFDRLGGYDTGFVANEDAEYDARVRAAGGKIWLAGEIEVGYNPRRTFAALARQYRRYGAGRAANAFKHGEIRLRQLIPPAVVLMIVIGTIVGLFWPIAFLLPAFYALGLAVATVVLLRRTRDAAVVLAFPALAIMHGAWGGGFLAQALKAAVGRSGLGGRRR